MYKVKDSKVCHDKKLFIKPSNMKELNQETQEKTGVSLKAIEDEGISFEEAMKRVITAYDNPLSSSQSSSTTT